jgi:hypothetical protein
MTRALRFFMLVRLHPSYVLAAMAACAAIGVWTVSVTPGDIDSGLGLIALVQMFTASSGFVPRSSAGYFDPMLVAGRSRVRAAAAHAIVSTAPGLLAWLVVSAAGLVLGSGPAPSALVGRRAAAMLIVSVLSWAAGFRLPRAGAGIVWVTLLVAVLMGHDARRLASAVDPTQHGVLVQAAAVVACPFLLIGSQPRVSSAALLLALSACAAALAATLGAFGRRDIMLVERS